MDRPTHLEKLPTELLSKIFVFCPDTETLHSLVSSSPILARIFHSRQTAFIRALLDHHIGPLVLPEVLLYYRVQQAIDNHPKDLLAVTQIAGEQLNAQRSLSQETWDLAKAGALLSIHDEIRPLAMFLLDQLLNHSPELVRFKQPKQASVSEFSRVESSLLLIFTWHLLDLWSTPLDRETIDDQPSRVGVTAYLGIEWDERFMAGYVKLFQQALPLVRMDQIRCCGVMLSRHIAYAVNELLRNDIEVSLARESLSCIVDRPEHWTTLSLLQEGPRWIQQFLVSNRRNRRELLLTLRLDRMDPSWIWPADAQMEGILMALEENTPVLRATIPSSGMWRFDDAPTYDPDPGPAIMSGLGRQFKPEWLWKWLPTWGYALWDRERLPSFGFLVAPDSNATRDGKNIVCKFNAAERSTQFPPPEAQIIRGNDKDWPTPFDMDDTAFEFSFVSRRTLSEKGHTGSFDYDTFREQYE